MGSQQLTSKSTTPRRDLSTYRMRFVIGFLALTFLVGVVAGRMEDRMGISGGTPVGRAIGGKPLVQDRSCTPFYWSCSSNLQCCSGRCSSGRCALVGSV